MQEQAADIWAHMFGRFVAVTDNYLVYLDHVDSQIARLRYNIEWFENSHLASHVRTFNIKRTE